MLFHRCKYAKVRDTATAPAYMSAGAVGFDFYACLDCESVILKVGSSMLIPTGIVLVIPKRHGLFLLDRSSFGYKLSVEVYRGLIDNDYTDELILKLTNNGTRDVTIFNGERFAQGIILKVPRWVFMEIPVEKIPKTERGKGGFGSTGRF